MSCQSHGLNLYFLIFNSSNFKSYFTCQNFKCYSTCQNRSQLSIIQQKSGTLTCISTLDTCEPDSYEVRIFGLVWFGFMAYQPLYVI